MHRERVEEVTPVERVYLAVDINNLWHSAKEAYGVQARVDYLELLRRVSEGGFNKVPRLVRAAAFTITSPRRRIGNDGSVREEPPGNDRFLEVLKGFGYQVHTRHMRFEKGIEKPFHTDWDVGITLEAMSLLEQYDTFVLASGDGDYGLLLKRIRELDKRIEIYTFKSAASPILHEYAHQVHFLDDAHVFQEKLKTTR